MHEQTGNIIVEKLTIERSMELLGDTIMIDIPGLLIGAGPSSLGDIICENSQPSGTNQILELELLGLIEKRIDPPNYNIIDDRFSVLL